MPPKKKKTAASSRKTAKSPASNKKPAKKSPATRKKAVVTSKSECGMPARTRGRAAAAPAQTRGSSDWRVAKSLLKLRDQVNAKWPNRNKEDDGTIGDTSHQNRSSDHNPWVDEGVVTALDITHDPGHGCDSYVLADTIRKSKDSRVKYIISNRRIANFAAIGGASAWAWRPYGGTNAHDRHCHISVKATKAQYDDQSAWTI
jgi:hypothetical protein